MHSRLESAVKLKLSNGPCFHTLPKQVGKRQEKEKVSNGTSTLQHQRSRMRA